MNPMRQRVWAEFETILRPLAPFENVLDLGSGDGWFQHQMSTTGLAKQIKGIDVQRRDSNLEHVWVEPTLYDGGDIPFPDRAFDLSYSVNVLHHCPAPVAQLKELMRCSERYLLLKDHTYRTLWGRLLLCAMDEIGNRRFGVPSRYQYQHRWEWFSVIEEEGFTLRHFTFPAQMHVGITGAVTNPLQFIALWERT
jgi:SAM-dependent methyltransferase